MEILQLMGSFWSSHLPERLKHELLRRESPSREYSPHHPQLAWQPLLYIRLVCISTDRSTLAVLTASGDVQYWHCCGLGQHFISGQRWSCCLDTIVMGTNTCHSSKSMVAEAGVKLHHELLTHPCRFLYCLHLPYSCGSSWHRGSRAADWRHDGGSDEAQVCAVGTMSMNAH